MRQASSSIWTRWLAVGLSFLLIPLSFWYAARATRPAPRFDPTVTREELRFSGDEAFEYARQLALDFPHRNTGGPNNLKAAQWLAQAFASMGLEARIDTFTQRLYSRPYELHNVVAIRPGQSPDALVVTAHFDHAPTAVQGADNDASGVGIMLQLAKVFAAEQPRHTLIFLANDGEEYGMLGSRHFIDNYDGRVIAAISLDNVGKKGATYQAMATIGQGRGYTNLWLVRLTQNVAEQLGLWRPGMADPVFQVLQRSVLISFTDQGPFLNRGVPSLGFGVGGVPWPYYHRPTDTIDHIAPETMSQVGLLTEAVLREMDSGAALQTIETPASGAPYTVLAASLVIGAGLSLAAPDLRRSEEQKTSSSPPARATASRAREG